MTPPAERFQQWSWTLSKPPRFQGRRPTPQTGEQPPLYYYYCPQTAKENNDNDRQLTTVRDKPLGIQTPESVSQGQDWTGLDFSAVSRNRPAAVGRRFRLVSTRGGLANRPRVANLPAKGTCARAEELMVFRPMFLSAREEWAREAL
ncbi:hypothetical protein ACJ73_09185 [Blastomyces percursus]|uniref:Uncharacterized protein n=1 Tax=Blastomyces percursus TaxID=1658174 RepID=A0A1J9QEK0_9EURO|nr:hypothetical protein ACJ73_09185 [Blastomyces percursus]